jgi:hypothetical protein
MKRVFISIGFVLCMVMALGQESHFVFIQQVEKKPFYVRMQDESFSSSPGGHIILPMLKDSVYNMFIGYPSSRTEYLFNIGITGMDRGFELSGANLTDLQTKLVFDAAVSNQNDLTGTKKTDAYSLLMAGVVRDTAVLYESTAKKDVIKPQPVTVSTPSVVYDKRDIIRYSTENVKEGKLMIYHDRSAPVTDTIRIIIPRL